MGKAAESNPAIDVWAIGVMFYSLLSGQLPFYSEDEPTTIKMIKTAPIKWLKDIPITPGAKEIISKMLEKDPSKRLDLMDFMDTDFYKSEDEAYQEVVATHLEEFERVKEEQKTVEVVIQSPIKPPSLSPGLKVNNVGGKKAQK
jgi:serine/threonine protein kinase